MRRRRALPAVVALCLTTASCGIFGGGDETTTSASSSSSTTTQSPTTSPGVQGEQASYLQGGNDPPPGLEDQIGYSISYSTSCAALLNGPEQVREYSPPPSAVARLVFGDVLYEAFVGRVEIDPTVAVRLAELTPTIDLDERAVVLPPVTAITVDPGALRPVLPSLAPLATLDPSLIELPGVTLPPSAPSTTIIAPPPAAIFEITQTSAAFFCGSGWSANAFLKTIITGPDGTIVVDRFDQAGDEGNVGPSWTPGLEDAVGRYTITLSDGSFTADAEFDVMAPSLPTIDVLGAATVEPGDPVRIGLVAFPPGSAVDLHIFAEDELVGWRYTGTAAGVAISELGSTIFELATLPDDPEGIYCVIRDPTRLYECKDVAFELAAG